MERKDPEVSSSQHRQALRELKQLCSGQRTLILATSHQDQPHCSLMTFALGPDERSFVLVTPKETRKLENVRHNSRVSTLLTEAGSSDPQEADGMTATINGRVHIVPGQERFDLTDLFVRKYPSLREFAESPQSAVLRMVWEEAILVKGIHSVLRLDLGKVPKEPSAPS